MRNAAARQKKSPGKRGIRTLSGDSGGNVDLSPDGTGRSQRLRTGFFVEFRFLLPCLAVGIDGGSLLRCARLFDVGASAGPTDSGNLSGVQSSLLFA